MPPIEQLGPFSYRWEEGCFPLGQDSLLLGSFATVKPGWRVCDLGSGAGALLLLLLGRVSTLTVCGVEISPMAADAARSNLADNGLPGEIITGDLRDLSGLPPAGQWDLVVSNPPWFPDGSGRSGGPEWMEEQCTLEQLCAAAARCLKNGGRFALVHRPDRLTDLLCTLRAAGLEPKRMQLVQHREDKAPSAVLLEAVRQGRPGLDVLPVRTGPVN